MGEVSRLVIPARLEHIRHACDFVVEAAEAAQLDERAVYHCQMAVDESLTNVIEHGYAERGETDDTIEVTCEIKTASFIITIIDSTPAFNPLLHSAPDPSEPLDSREPGGWGIYFIQKLMDEVHYERINNHNHLVLVKNRVLVEMAADAAPDSDDGVPVEALSDGGIVIRPAGRLDSNTSPVLERVLLAQLEQGNVWIFVDMDKVEYIASSGLKVLVAAWRRAQERDGKLVLSGLRPRIIEIFEMVGFDMLFEIFPDLDAALTAQPNRG